MTEQRPEMGDTPCPKCRSLVCEWRAFPDCQEVKLMALIQAVAALRVECNHKPSGWDALEKAWEACKDFNSIAGLQIKFDENLKPGEWYLRK
jgi:hypothetical protein